MENIDFQNTSYNFFSSSLFLQCKIKVLLHKKKSYYYLNLTTKPLAHKVRGCIVAYWNFKNSFVESFQSRPKNNPRGKLYILILCWVLLRRLQWEDSRNEKATRRWKDNNGGGCGGDAGIDYIKFSVLHRFSGISMIWRYHRWVGGVTLITSYDVIWT